MDSITASAGSALAGTVAIFSGHVYVAGALALCAMILFFAYKLSTTSSISALITKFGEAHGADMTEIKESLDALKNEQAVLVAKVAELETKVDTLGCASAPGCPNRVKG